MKKGIRFESGTTAITVFDEIKSKCYCIIICQTALFGAVCAIVIYGGITNPASALLWGSESLNLKMILGYYLTGFPMDCIHAAATVVFLLFVAEPMLEKLDRIKVKYGLAE